MAKNSAVLDQPTYDYSNLDAGQQTQSVEKVKRTRTVSPYRITLTLDADTYAFFEAQAKEDDRELDKFIARWLRKAIL